ncbi:hypothetical protein MTR67_039392, partial [Solanum verrucosum]
KRNKAAETTKKKSVPNPEGENQVGDKREQSASCGTVLRCSAKSAQSYRTSRILKEKEKW